MLMRLPFEPPASAERPAEAATENIVESGSPLHGILWQGLIHPLVVYASAVENQLESLYKLVSAVAYDAEKVHEIAVNVIVDFNRAWRLVE